MSMNYALAGGKQRRYPVCQRKFTIYDGWVYRRGSSDHEQVFCSWRCLRKFDKGYGSAAERRERIIQAINDGLNAREVSVLLGEDYSKVFYWEKKIREQQRKEAEALEHETEPAGSPEED